jgi:hypothetical protein
LLLYSHISNRYRVGLRSAVGAFPGMRHEASAYRIDDDVADDEHPLAVVADHPLEDVSLPEGARESPLVVVARVLLRGPDERLAVRIAVDAANQQMNVIGHEAVRGEFEPILACSTQNLRPHEIDSG